MKPGIAERLLPNPGKNIPYLDAIRGVAVIFILVRHAWGFSWSPSAHVAGIDLGRFIVMMSSGVDLFFVLSGVLLSARFLRADALQQPAPSFFEYITARILRIGPPYWLVLFLVVLLYTPVYISADRVWSGVGGATFLSHLFFGQSLFIFSFGAYPVETPFWTLTIEMVFYLVLPLVVRIFYKGRWWQGVLASLLLTYGWLFLCRYSMSAYVNFVGSHAFGLQYSAEAIRFFLSHQILGYLPHFSIGIAISVILQRKRGLWWTSGRAGLIYMGCGIVLLLMTMYVLGGLSLAGGYADPQAYFRNEGPAALTYYFFEATPFALAYGLIILGASLSKDSVRRGISNIPGLCLFGVLGYSIYLIHMPLIYTMNNHWWIATDGRPWWHLAKFLTVGVAVIVGLSYLMFVGIERPSMIWAANATRYLSGWRASSVYKTLRGFVTTSPRDGGG